MFTKPLRHSDSDWLLQIIEPLSSDLIKSICLFSLLLLISIWWIKTLKLNALFNVCLLLHTYILWLRAIAQFSALYVNVS